MHSANGVGVFVWRNRVVWGVVLSALVLCGTGCNERLKRMESNQVVLEEKIDFNSRQVLVLARKVDMSQAVLETRIDRVQEGSNVALAEARATRYEQEKLREDTRRFDKKWYAGITRVEEQQQSLQNAVDGVAGTATEIDEGVEKLDAGQAVARQAMADNHTQTLASFADVRAGQDDLKDAATEAFKDLEEGQEDIVRVASEAVDGTAKVSQQVAQVQKSQDVQSDVIRDNQATLVAKLDGVAKDQQRFQRATTQKSTKLSRQMADMHKDLKEGQEGIMAVASETVKATAGVSRQVTQVQKSEDVQSKVIRSGQATIVAKVDGVAKDQQRFHRATTGESEELSSQMADMHKDLKEDSAVQSNMIGRRADHIDANLKAAQKNQDNLRVQLNEHHEEVTQVGEKVSTIGAEQTRMHTAMQKASRRISSAVKGVGENQQALKETLDNVEATAETTQRQTETIAEEQSKFHAVEEIRHDRVMKNISELGSTQEETHSTVGLLDDKAATLGQAQEALKTDIEAAEAGMKRHLADQKNMSQDLADQIERVQQEQVEVAKTMEVKQKAWEDQTADLTHRVASLEESLGHVDKNVASLQTNLVSQITELTKVMKTLQEQSAAQIAQMTADMKAFNGTLRQIQATQDTLTQRIDQVGASQTQQSKEFLTALEKLQKRPEDVAVVKPVEVEVKEVNEVK